MGRIRTAAKENEIVAAASVVFAARPFHEVLVDDIAEEAGVGKGTIYRYFDTKEALYLETVLRGITELNVNLAGSLEADPTSRRRLVRLAREILEIFWGRPDIYPLMQRTEDRLRAPQTRIRRERARLVATIAATIADGTARGEFRDLDSGRAAEFFMGLVRSCLLHHRPDDRIASLAEDLVSMFVDGAAGRTAS